MKIGRCILIFILVYFHSTSLRAQDANNKEEKEIEIPVAINGLPSNQKSGQCEPGFILKGSFYRYQLVNGVVLNLKLINATWNDPNPRFNMVWEEDGERWGDNVIGREPFYTIKQNLSFWTVRLRVTGPNGEMKDVDFHKDMQVEFPWVKGQSNIDRCMVYVLGIIGLGYGTETNRAFYEAIKRVKDERKKVEEQKNVPVKIENREAPQNTSETPKNNKGSIGVQEKQNNSQIEKGNSIPNRNNIQSDKSEVSSNSGTQDGKIKQILRDENGNFWVQLPNGTMARLDDEQNQQFKQQYAINQKANFANQQEITKQQRDQEFKNKVDQLKREQEITRQKAIQMEKDLNTVSSVLIQNFYQGEAVRNGRQRMYELSMMSGNFESVSQINETYQSNYREISQEAQNIQNAQYATFSSGLSALGTVADPLAAGIGGGVLAVGSIAVMANNDKKEREAKEELQRQRNAAILSFKLKRKQTRLKIVEDFPMGGTPLQQHKITASDLFFIAYYLDTSQLMDENPVIRVSNVFSIPKQQDGSYIYKSQLLKKLKSSFGVEPIIVGYFIDDSHASQIQSGLIKVAELGKLSVEQVVIKSKSSETMNNDGNTDFWEVEQPVKKAANTNKTNGTKPPVKQKEVNDPFWDMN
jgi:hypothetical protein